MVMLVSVDWFSEVFELAAISKEFLTSAELQTTGGISYSSAEAGFSCDNVVSAEIVLSGGSIKNVSATSYPDLHRALRGGSNNFGVVTRLDMTTLPLGRMWGGTTYYPLDTYAQQIENLYSFTADPDYDKNAALIQSYGGEAGEMAVLNNYAYGKPTPTPPAIFQPFTTIVPQLLNTTRESNLTDFVLEQSAASPVGFRYVRDVLDFSSMR